MRLRIAELQSTCASSQMTSASGMTLYLLFQLYLGVGPREPVWSPLRPRALAPQTSNITN